MAHDAKHRKNRKGGAAKMILIVLLIAFWCFMMNKQSGGGAGPMQFGKARAKLAQDDKRKVTFNDVAGADEESLNEFGRFDKLIDSLDTARAREYFSALEGAPIPAFKVRMRADNLLRRFVLEGGFDL